VHRRKLLLDDRTVGCNRSMYSWGVLARWSSKLHVLSDWIVLSGWCLELYAVWDGHISRDNRR
jgi:hypothetical protein